MQFHQPNDEAPVHPELGALLSTCSSLEEIARAWLVPGSRIRFENGVDERDAVDSLLLVFVRNNSEYGQVFVSLSDVRQQYPKLPVISKAFIAREVPEAYELSSCDNSFYSNLETLYGAEYNDAFCATQIPFELALILAIAHGVSLGGDATLSRYDREEISDRFDEFSGDSCGLTPEACVSLDYTFLDPSTGQGWMGDYVTSLAESPDHLIADALHKITGIVQ